MLILYADDDPEDAEVFSEVVRSINPKIVCIVTKDGSEVIPFLENTLILPDFIFLDINMPLMNGKDCLVQLKSNQRFKSIPVIMYTTSTRKSDQEEIRKLGAADYVMKPSTFSDLQNLISKFLSTGGARFAT